MGQHLLTMYRVVVLAKLVSHVFSESCELNHQTQDFTINFEGSEFTLKIDDESGTVTTPTRPSTHSAPVTTVTPITTAETTTSDYYVSVVNPEETDKPYEYGPTAAQTAIIEKLSAWSNRQKNPCKAFTENNNGVRGKWTVCPFGGENGESIQDHKNSFDMLEKVLTGKVIQLTACQTKLTPIAKLNSTLFVNPVLGMLSRALPDLTITASLNWKLERTRHVEFE